MNGDPTTAVLALLLGSSVVVAVIGWVKDRAHGRATVERLSTAALSEALEAVRAELRQVRADLEATRTELATTRIELETTRAELARYKTEVRR